MENIVSIHSVIHKKMKKSNHKTKNSASLNSSNEHIRKYRSISTHKNILIKEEIPKIRKINSQDKLSIKKENNIFHQTLTKLTELKRYSFSNKLKDLQQNKYSATPKEAEISIKKVSCIDLENDSLNKNIESSNRVRKPNYLMKSAFIKDIKTLTPTCRLVGNKFCPIYDFYSWKNNFKDISSSKNENVQNSDTNKNFDYIPTPSSNSDANYFYNFFISNQKNSQNDMILYEEDGKINEDLFNKSYSENEESNKISSDSEAKNEKSVQKEKQKLEDWGVTPTNAGGLASPSYDFFINNIFNKSPIKYKQMNVNININNNSQNNNIYYQSSNLINNFNNGNINNENINNFINKNNNIKNNKNEDKEDLNYMNINLKKNEYNNSINNNLNKNYNNNKIKMDNIMNINFKNENISQNVRKNRNNNNLMNNYSDLNYDINNQQQLLINNKINNSNYMIMNNINNINNTNNINNQNKIDPRIIQLLNMNNQNSNNIDLINYLYNLQNNNNNFINNNINNLNQLNNIKIQNIQLNNLNNLNNFNQNKNFPNFSLLANQFISNNYQNNNNKLSFIQNNNINQNLINNINNNPQQQHLVSYMNNRNDINKNILNNNNINQEYLNIDYSKLSLIELADQLNIISKNPNGCNYIINIIESNPKLLSNIFYPKILKHLQELSNNQYSHYLVLKILPYFNEEMIFRFIIVLSPIIADIGSNQYGTKIIQDFIDILHIDKQIQSFIELILPHTTFLVSDLNGSQIIYKLITKKSPYVKIIEKIICVNVKEIALTRKGSSFLSKYINFAEKNELSCLTRNIIINLLPIITDQYGNYLIQFLIMKDDTPFLNEIVNNIINNLIFYSNQKYASNVVEKCIENEKIRNLTIAQFLRKEVFEQVICNCFGNYVIQKVIAKSDINTQNHLFQFLIPLIPKLKSQAFGQKLLRKLMKTYPNLNIINYNN